MYNLFVNRVNHFNGMGNHFEFIANVQVGLMPTLNTLAPEQIAKLTKLHTRKLELQFPSVDEAIHLLGYYEYFDLSKCNESNYVASKDELKILKLSQEQYSQNKVEEYIKEFEGFAKAYYEKLSEEDKKLHNTGSVELTVPEIEEFKDICNSINEILFMEKA